MRDSSNCLFELALDLPDLALAFKYPDRHFRSVAIRHANGLEVIRPPSRANLPSLYASLAGISSVYLAQLVGSGPPSCCADGRGLTIVFGV